MNRTHRTIKNHDQASERARRRRGHRGRWRRKASAPRLRGTWQISAPRGCWRMGGRRKRRLPPVVMEKGWVPRPAAAAAAAARARRQQIIARDFARLRNVQQPAQVDDRDMKNAPLYDPSFLQSSGDIDMTPPNIGLVTFGNGH